MRNLRFLIIALATICVLALGAFALVNRPAVPTAGDDIIIKGGSLTIECVNAANKNCLSSFNNNTKQYSHKNTGGKIEQIVVMDSSGAPLPNGTFTRTANFPDGKPQISIAYK
jgi:hypothetical protein